MKNFYLLLCLCVMVGCAPRGDNQAPPAEKSLQSPSSGNTNDGQEDGIKKSGSIPSSVHTEVVPSPPTTAQPTTESVISNLDYKKAKEDLEKGNIYSPNKNNAVEHLLKARSAFAAPQPEIETALMDLLPYVVMGAEAAIDKKDVSEAARLISIIEIISPDAPSLPRLHSGLSALTVE